MQTKLRIIQVINVRWYNATAWYGLSLARLLQQAGHDVLVVALPGTETGKKAADGVSDVVTMNLNTTSIFWTIRNWQTAKNLIQSFQPHIVNCHRGEAMVLWGLLKAREKNFALVRTRGDQRPPKANPVNRYLYAGLSDAVIATNSRTEQQCASLLRVPPQKLHCIPGGVDTGVFRPDPTGRQAVRKKYGFRDSDLVIGVLGRFDPVKGHESLIRALRRIRDEAGTAWDEASPRLLLMGFAANISIAHMQALLKDNGLDRIGVITGRVEEVPAHICAMDLGVIPSIGSEAIARAAFEIMGCGVPLVGTDVGVMPDLLAPEDLAPVGDDDALAALLRQAMFDPEHRRTVAERQAARMAAFSHPAFLKKTLAVYHRALGIAGV